MSCAACTVALEDDGTRCADHQGALRTLVWWRRDPHANLGHWIARPSGQAESLLEGNLHLEHPTRLVLNQGEGREPHAPQGYLLAYGQLEGGCIK